MFLFSFCCLYEVLLLIFIPPNLGRLNSSVKLKRTNLVFLLFAPACVTLTQGGWTKMHAAWQPVRAALLPVFLVEVLHVWTNFPSGLACRVTFTFERLLGCLTVATRYYFSNCEQVMIISKLKRHLNYNAESQRSWTWMLHGSRDRKFKSSLPTSRNHILSPARGLFRFTARLTATGDPSSPQWPFEDTLITFKERCTSLITLYFVLVNCIKSPH